MSAKQPPLSLTELKKKHPPVRNVNQQHKANLSRLENAALWITDHVGTMGFFLMIAAWTLIWLTWNTLAPTESRFDPFPAFVLWLFISNMIQISLMPLLMIGQNLHSRHAETRAESDYEVNLRAKQETETILLHLEEQQKILRKIAEHLNIEQNA